MAEAKIWHNPRCSTSRLALEYLDEKGVEVEIFKYMDEGIDPAELAGVIKMSGHPLQDFVRTFEHEYRELGLHEKNLTIDEFAEIAAKYPKLLQRPIIIKDGKAVLARPTAKIDAVL